MIISIVDGTDIDDKEVQRVVRAVNRQLAEDFKRHWHRDVQLRVEGWTGKEPDPENPVDLRGDAVLYLWDKPDVADALGYHDQTGAGVPYGFVFTNLSDELGDKWSVTLSHEALELAMDPEVNLLAAGPHPDPKEKGRTVYHWYELCDAVQDLTYVIDGVEVANFVLPLYFTTGEEHKNHNDFLGSLLPSFGVAKGGYVGFLDPETKRHKTYNAPGDKKAERRRRAKQSFLAITRGGRHGAEGEPIATDWTKLTQCDAISFKLDGGGTLAAARKLAGQVLGKGWRVAAVRSSPGEFDAVHKPSGRPGFSEAWELAHRLSEHPAVLRAEPSLSYPVPGASDSAAEGTTRRMSSSFSGGHLPGTQRARWGLDQCRVPEAWTIAGSKPGKGVIVGHPDSGYRPHEEMDPVRVRSDIDFDFLDADEDAATPKGNHGLSTASVIMSGTGGTGDELAGAALHSEILPLRVTQAVGPIPAPVLFVDGMRRLRDAIDYAIRQSCGVISMSLGGPFPSDSLRDAIGRARAHGLIVLAAAGNEVGFVTFPARWDEVIAVGGCNIERLPWSGSCHGPAVDITAPAESVWRAFCDDDGKAVLGRSSGTSYAVALTAGVAAVWLAHHGHRKLVNQYGGEGVQAVFLHLLRKTAQKNHKLPVGEFGAGILDAAALMSAALPAAAPRIRARAGAHRELDALAGAKLDDLGPQLAAELVSAVGLRAALTALTPGTPGRARSSSTELDDGSLNRGLSPRLKAALSR